ncbi:hypothetical protein [Streptomyces anulatus]|uniref:hypothetical protein n=1 Tax=Streptomyces anulatus TaxID=1892 RepID=UPI001675C825|nr:hypothetical protein [Streptomyces anulatus]GGY58625.1 hypothetical protein GCM10010342_52940 [Streptomyces anulatus]
MAGPPKLRHVDLSALLAHPSTEILTPSPAETTASAALLNGLAREDDDEQTVKVQHHQEVLTGYQLGDAALALDGEPRADFLPGIPLLHRYAVKAAELGIGVTTICRWTARSRRRGRPSGGGSGCRQGVGASCRRARSLPPTGVLGDVTVVPAYLTA